ncbi:MAG: PQQ-binding-like beta-propeller repeat protein [Planctomycetota bacterium]
MRLAYCILAVLLCLVPVTGNAQGVSALGDAAEPTLAEQSLPLRTALHHEPTLDAPLQALVKLYRHQNRLDELLALYDQHLKQWPQDTSARTVHLRLLLAVSDPTALAATRATAKAQPEHAFFRYLLFRALEASGEEGALDELHQAIKRCEKPQLQRTWIETFLPLAISQGRVAQAAEHLKTLSGLAGEDPVAKLHAARMMMLADQHELALSTLEAASELPMPAESLVEYAMTTAKALAKLERKQEAAARLDQLLDRVSTDYWRRPEIIRQRLGLVDTDLEREKMIELAKSRVDESPGDSGAVISLADLLVGFERYRSALNQLREASEQMPESRALEEATLALLDRMRDEVSRSEFLQQRLEREPDRRDLRVQLARSYYLLGRDKEALEAFELAIDKQAEDEQFVHLLESARFLRESALVEPSTTFYARAAKLRPERLDVKRELAEVYLVLDQRDKVRELFTVNDHSGAAIENVLDLADFLISNGFLAEAKTLVEPGIEQSPTHLDLRLLKLRIHGELAAGREGSDLIDRTRKLTDTTARYHRWLEAAVKFHDNFDTVESFLTAEGQRLSDPPKLWSDEAVQRRLAYVEVSESNRHTENARELLSASLSQSPPEAIELRFRRELLSLLDSQRDRVELQKMLSELAEENEALRDEANAQLVVMHSQQNRWDLAQPLLAVIDPTKIHELSLLRALLDVCRRVNDHSRALQMMERMVELNPTSRTLWEGWLQTLAFRGDESRFRAAVRRLSIGIEKMPLNDDSRQRLRAHLLSSYWRSIGHLERRADPDAWNQALGLLASAQQVVHEPRELTWIIWMRASMLNRLGRVAARDEALFELDLIARSGVAKVGDVDGSTGDVNRGAEEISIVFPDGLQVSLAEARRVLTEPPMREALLDERQGPMPSNGKVTQRWALRIPDVSIAAVYRGIDDQIVIADDAGGLWGINRSNGKLIWHEPELLPRLMSTERGSGLVALNAAPIRAPHDRLIATDGKDVVCVSLRERSVQWRSPIRISTGSNQQNGYSTELVIDGSNVLAYDVANEQLVWFDLATGKLADTLMLREQGGTDSPIPAQVPQARYGRLSRNGERLLVIGSRVTIVNLTDRRIAWRFDPKTATQFPIKLETPKTDEEHTDRSSAQAVSRPTNFQGSIQWQQRQQLVAGQSQVVFRSSNISHHHTHPSPHRTIYTQRPTQFVDISQAQKYPHLAQQPGNYVLTSPVMAWMQQANVSLTGTAALLDDDIVLMSHAGMVSWSYRNPLGAERIAAMGTHLGVSGGHAVFMQSRMLQRVHAGRGVTARAQVQEAGIMHDGCVDGPAIYVAGNQGVVALNTITGKRLWMHSWADARANREPIADEGLIDGLRSQPPSYLPSIVAFNAQGQTKLRPLVSRPMDGVLYITRSPNELVAIQGVTQ